MILLRVLPSADEGLMLLPDRGRSLLAATKLLKKSCERGEIPQCIINSPYANLTYSVMPQISAKAGTTSFYASIAIIVGGESFGSLRLSKRATFYLLELYDAGNYDSPPQIRKVA